MSVEEFYGLYGDYKFMISQLGSNEKIVKFLRFFLSDDSFETMIKGLDERNVDLAFAGAHTLKGVASNLGLTKLCDVNNPLVESLRSKDLDNAIKLVVPVRNVYYQIVEEIKRL